MTSSSDVSKLLAESRALRLAFRPEIPVAEIQPVTYGKPLPWKYWYAQILAEDDFQWQDIIVNIYITDGPVGITEAPVGMTVIVHGHSREVSCFSKHKCQSLGLKEKHSVE